MNFVKHLFDGTVKLTWTAVAIVAIAIACVAGGVQKGYRAIRQSMQDYPAYRVAWSTEGGDRQIGIRIYYNENVWEFVPREADPELWAKHHNQ